MTSPSASSSQLARRVKIRRSASFPPSTPHPPRASSPPSQRRPTSSTQALGPSTSYSMRTTRRLTAPGGGGSSRARTTSTAGVVTIRLFEDFFFFLGCLGFLVSVPLPSCSSFLWVYGRVPFSPWVYRLLFPSLLLRLDLSLVPIIHPRKHQKHRITYENYRIRDVSEEDEDI
ncbi:hypothetical protein DFH06DRAFT_1164239, partial [Mycena polygramma]